MERKVEQIERVTYKLSPTEVKHAIMAWLLDEHGASPGSDAQFDIFSDGSARVTNDYPKDQSQ